MGLQTSYNIFDNENPNDSDPPQAPSSISLRPLWGTLRVGYRPELFGDAWGSSFHILEISSDFIVIR